MITAAQARATIEAHLTMETEGVARVLGDLDEPTEVDGECRVLVAATPWGPLVVMGFRLSPVAL